MLRRWSSMLLHSLDFSQVSRAQSPTRTQEAAAFKLRSPRLARHACVDTSSTTLCARALSTPAVDAPPHRRPVASRRLA